MLTSTKRILPIALVAALLGGSVGAFVMRAPKTTQPVDTTTTATSPVETQANNAAAVTTLNPEQVAFRDGFEEGFLAAQQNGATDTVDANYKSNYRTNASPAYSNVRRGTTTNRRAYNHVVRQPQKRSFWQKHRDKLTVAMGTGGGAALGGVIGGKKGAIIGALAGAGGSALYTYKIRKKDRQN